MAQISARTATWAKGAVVPVALLVSGVAVSQASYSAFSDSTATSSTNWAAGTVKLTKDVPTTALFTAANLKPGESGTKCIAVTSSGSLASTVKIYGTGYTNLLPNDLGSNITVDITQGPGVAADCSTFTGTSLYSGSLDVLGTTNKTFATGLGNWAPTGTPSEIRTYKITYTLKSDAPNSTQGGTAALGFTWEAQNS